MTLIGTFVNNFDGTEYVNQIYGTLGHPSYGTMYNLDNATLQTIIEQQISADVINKVEKRITNIVLKDYFPRDIINNCTISNVQGYNSVDTSTLQSGRYITWNLGTLPDGYVANLEYTIKINDMENSPLIGNQIATNEKVECTYTPHSRTPTSTILSDSPIIKLNGWESLTFNKQSNVTSNTVVEGQEVTYTLTATNAGNMDATALFKDSAPNGTSFIDGSVSVNDSPAAYTAQNLIDGVSLPVPKRGSVALSFKVRVNKLPNGTKISNTANFQDITDPNTPPEPTPKTVEFDYLEPVISSTKTSQTEFKKDYIVKDERITYTINISNTGGLGKDVVVKDTIPEGTSFVDGSITWNGNPLTKADGSLYTYSDLTAGITLNIPANTQNQALSFVVTVGDLENSTSIKNTAYVDDKPVPEDNSHNYIEPIISSKKTSQTEFNKDYIVKGEKITYTITVSNTGGLGKDVVIKDTVPEGTSFVDGSITWNGTPLTKADGSLYTYSDLTAGITLNIPANTGNQALSFIVTAQDLKNGSSIKNTAYVDDEPVPEDNSHNYMEPIISSKKTSQTEFKKDYVVNGEKITYTINISNTGGLGKDVVIKDTVPEGTSFVEQSIMFNGSTLKKQDGSFYTVSDLANGITLNIPANTGNQTLSFVVTVGTLENGTIIKNTANVDGADISDDSSHKYVTPIINTVKTATTEYEREYVVAGEKITYSIIVANSGSLEKTVIIKDVLSDSVTFVDGSIMVNGEVYKDSSGKLLDISDLKNGIELLVPAKVDDEENMLNQTVLSFDVVVNKLPSDENTFNISNVATVDNVPTNSVEFMALPFNMKIDKQIKSFSLNGEYIDSGNDKLRKIEIVASTIPKASVTITYNLIVTNTGMVPGTATIQDIIPDGFVVDDSTPSYWNTNSSGNLETTTDVIEPGESQEFPVVLTWVNSTTNFGEKINNAEILSASDGISDNAISSGENSETDDYSSATILMSIKTGAFSNVELIVILLVSTILLTIGAVVIKKKVLKK